MRTAIAAFAGGALLFAGLSARAQGDTCLFQVPQVWQSQSSSVQWIGDCHDTYADGPGVLRLNGEVPQVFYGQLTLGKARGGVFERAEGLQAGLFVDGAWQPAKTRAERDAAWRTGLEAARKTRDYFRGAGVERAAEGYAKVVQRLESAKAR